MEYDLSLRPVMTEAVVAEATAFCEAVAAEPLWEDPNLKARTVAREARQALEGRKPFSMVRLGDGEGGCLLWGKAEVYPALADFVSRLCMTRHFGPHVYGPDDLSWMRQDIARAARQANVVTFARRAAVHLRILTEPMNDVRGVVGALFADRWLLGHRKKLAGQVYRDGYLHRDLLPYYRDIAQDAEIILVSSLTDEAAQHVATALGGRFLKNLRIPGQWSNGARDGSLYPVRLREIAGELADLAQPGRLVLVGAGLAGKGLCARAASAGAVALDTGSIMDVWTGRGVRVYQSPEFVEKHRL